MVKRGYRVIAASTAGLANIHLPTTGSIAATDSEILGIGYLGVEVNYRMTEKQKDTQTGTQTKSLERNVQYVPTEAYQQICTEYSQLSASSSTVWETPPKLSPMHNGPDRDYTKETIHGKTMPVLSPIMTRYPRTRCKLGSTGSDSASVDTAWSETSEEDSFLSVFNSNYDELESCGSTIDIDTSDEFEEALETPFIGMDIETLGSKSFRELVADISTGSDEVNKDNRNRLVKVRTMNDLNNERYYARTQTTESLNNVLGNINDLEGKENHHENKENNTGMHCQNDFANEIAVGNLVNSNKNLCRKGTDSNDLILDMQKYVIQKENIHKENYNNMKWHVKCSECKPTNGNSQFDLSTTSPDNVPRYPLDDFYKERQNITSKTNRKIANIILCGCAQGNANSPRKHRKRTKREKKTNSRFPTLGFSRRK